MEIVSSPGDPVDDEIEAKCMFSKVFPYVKNTRLGGRPGLGKQVDQAWVNRLTRPG